MTQKTLEMFPTIWKIISKFLNVTHRKFYYLNLFYVLAYILAFFTVIL